MGFICKCCKEPIPDEICIKVYETGDPSTHKCECGVPILLQKVENVSMDGKLYDVVVDSYPNPIIDKKDIWCEWVKLSREAIVTMIEGSNLYGDFPTTECFEKLDTFMRKVLEENYDK